MKKRAKSRKSTAKTRVSITVPAEHYAELQRIAGRKRVSLAWVVREALDKYLVSDTPLFHATS
jgi:hypothetical protein